ncbi:MAG TPA: class I SAM-dependent methyltransferase [Thermoplasmata archaeon]|nr:class I SAM-dependent methyltransferase [Thermoplasmata archaeon]
MSARSVGARHRGNHRERAWDRYWTEVHRGGRDHPGEFTRWAVPFLRSANARNVVDLGCGAGRDLSFLLEQGFSVTGVDCSTVATELSAKAISRLDPKVRGRGCTINDDLLDYLLRLKPESVDAIHAAATYQALSDREVSELFGEVHRVLAKGGLHLWTVRNKSHPGRIHPELVPPNFPMLGFTVSVHFFSVEDVGRFRGVRFEQIALQETADSYSYLIADRKRGQPEPPPA